MVLQLPKIDKKTFSPFRDVKAFVRRVCMWGKIRETTLSILGAVVIQQSNIYAATLPSSYFEKALMSAWAISTNMIVSSNLITMLHNTFLSIFWCYQDMEASEMLNLCENARFQTAPLGKQSHRVHAKFVLRNASSWKIQRRLHSPKLICMALVIPGDKNNSIRGEPP